MKIYCKSEWIDVEIGDERIGELDIVIEQDAVIGQGARIGQGAMIGQGAVIGQDAWINVIKLYIQQYTITICNGLFWIGCEGHTIEDWEANKDEIVRRNKISTEDKDWYESQFQAMKHLVVGE